MIGMNRRRALWLVGSMSMPLQRSLAQPVAALPRVVMVLTSNEEVSRPYREGFAEGMRQAGHVEGCSMPAS
jgi:hypothetical protein